MEFSKIFTERLKRARELSGLTQKEVARQLGIHEGSYRNYESGFRQPSLETLIKIAEILDTTPNYLLGI